jgi:uncharacterized membrane protein YfcA
VRRAGTIHLNKPFIPESARERPDPLRDGAGVPAVPFRPRPLMAASALDLSVLAISTLVTSFISGILGMAGGMILMGVLLALLPLPAAMMLHGIAQLAANGWRALMLRRSIDWRVFGGYAAGALLMLVFFAFLRFVVSKPAALIAMGLMPFVAFALPERLHLNVERPWHPFACGNVCSALSLTAGIAGPMLDVFFVRSKMTRHQVIATKATTQSFSHLLKIIYFGGMTLGGDGAGINPWVAAAIVVLAIAGTTASRRVLERISDASFRRWTQWTVMTLGVAYLASGVIALIG